MRAARRGLARVLMVLAALLSIAGIALAFHVAVQPAGGSLLPLALAALLVAAVGAVAAGFILLERHFEDLDRLRGALLVAAGRDGPLPPDWPPLGDSRTETVALGAAAARAINAHRALGGRLDEKLASVVGAAAEGLLVMTANGQVSLVNAAAMKVFGADAVAVGTSVYAALERDGMAELEHRIDAAGEAAAVHLPHVDGRSIEAIMAPLGEHGGYVLSLPHRAPGRGNPVAHDLTLHDRPPAVSIGAGALDGWPLEDLPVAVFDAETTGLDVALDRVVSLGAVRGHGWRLYPHANLDCLVNPGMAIPRQSTAIHGITDAMAAAAPGFAEAWPRLRGIMAGCVVVGHSIGFDLAIVRRECERHGAEWSAPPALDVALLHAALRPKQTGISLDRLAEQYGIEIEGRHTALGDALVTAEIWLALLPLLIEHGVRGYGAARRFSATAAGLLAQQRRAGWLVAADGGPSTGSG
jgi:DNA polymerase-3 subunit epsilon